jgi:hypothetical protein
MHQVGFELRHHIYRAALSRCADETLCKDASNQQYEPQPVRQVREISPMDGSINCR